MDMTSSTSTDTTMMSMSDMMMTFFTSSTTSLYSAAWTPSTTGGYAGTCIFLIILAALFRGLLAVKAWKENAWVQAEYHRRYVTVPGKLPMAERITSDSDSKRMVLSENGVEENVIVVQKHGLDAKPWRITVDPLRAGMDTVLVGISYLLMIAAMTMNVGYFLSILGGTFLGSLLLGRYTPHFAH